MIEEKHMSVESIRGSTRESLARPLEAEIAATVVSLIGCCSWVIESG